MGAERRKEEIIFFINLFFASWVGFPLFPEILYFITIILQRIRIIVGDAGFEPKTSAPEVWCATNEPPKLQVQNNSNPSQIFCYPIYSTYT